MGGKGQDGCGGVRWWLFEHLRRDSPLLPPGEPVVCWGCSLTAYLSWNSRAGVGVAKCESQCLFPRSCCFIFAQLTADEALIPGTPSELPSLPACWDAPQPPRTAMQRNQQHLNASFISWHVAACSNLPAPCAGTCHASRATLSPTMQSGFNAIGGGGGLPVKLYTVRGGGGGASATPHIQILPGSRERGAGAMRKPLNGRGQEGYVNGRAAFPATRSGGHAQQLASLADIQMHTPLDELPYERMAACRMRAPASPRPS